MKRPAISYIVPAYNEELSLPHALCSIGKYTPTALSHEVIVADNGSQDKTITVALEHHAKVIVDDTATVGRLRNLAVEEASGHVLVFLDADILLTEAWGENINTVFQSLIENPWQITGSRCGISTQPSWVEKYWFSPLINKKVKYINSGHLITTPDLFRKVGGFDERLESGEDYAFGVSACHANATVTNNPLLAVVHEGYPKTLLQFINREIWHGRGECKSLRTIRTSKVAIASILFFGVHVFTIASLIYFSSSILGVAGMLMIIGICIGSAFYKHDARSISSLVIVSMLYYFYYSARFLSCVPLISNVIGKHNHR